MPDSTVITPVGMLGLATVGGAVAERCARSGRQEAAV
jgi:hypothetical protein